MVRVITTRYQDAVPFYIENGFAQAGATAANAVVKAWTDKGGKVLCRSRPVPIKQIIVSTRMPEDEQQKIRDALLDAARLEARPRRARRRRVQGLRRAQSGSRELDHRLARACSDANSASRCSGTSRVLEYCTAQYVRREGFSPWPTSTAPSTARSAFRARSPTCCSGACAPPASATPSACAARTRSCARPTRRAEDAVRVLAAMVRNTRSTPRSARCCTGTRCASAATSGSSTRPPASRRCSSTNTK